MNTPQGNHEGLTLPAVYSLQTMDPQDFIVRHSLVVGRRKEVLPHDHSDRLLF
jgi:hypothetical protein